MRFEIPGYGILTLENVLMDFNGTIAMDGLIKEGVKQRIARLAENYRLYVLTSDTQKTAARELAGLPVTLEIYSTAHAGESKYRFADRLGGPFCACIGNGRNDLLMFNAAALSIAVLESEGLYAPLLATANVLVRSSEEALDLLLDEKRLLSVLRG